MSYTDALVQQTHSPPSTYVRARVIGDVMTRCSSSHVHVAWHHMDAYTREALASRQSGFLYSWGVYFVWVPIIYPESTVSTTEVRCTDPHTYKHTWYDKRIPGSIPVQKSAIIWKADMALWQIQPRNAHTKQYFSSLTRACSQLHAYRCGNLVQSSTHVP